MGLKESQNDDMIIGKKQQDNWYVKYEPKCLSQVAIHKRKLNDIVSEIKSILDGKSEHKIVLLTGPSGCSKSTVIKLIANELIPEYRKQNNNGFKNASKDACFTEYSTDDTTISPLYSFENFLESVKYLVGPNLQLILVEDLPNIFYPDIKLRFQNSLKKWINDDTRKNPPLVICLTECEIPALYDENSDFHRFTIEQKFISETVFDKEILNSPSVFRIRFNPINKTLITKVLKDIQSKEKLQLQKNDKLRGGKPLRAIQEIAGSCGDIRSAITNFQNWAMMPPHVNPAIHTRQEGVSYFHAVGKCVFGSQHANNDTGTMIDALIENYVSIHDPNLKLGVYENYHISKDLSISVASDILDIIGLSDIMGTSSNIANDEYCFRGVRERLKGGVDTESSHRKIKFPREWKMNKKRFSYRSEVDDFYLLNISKYKENFQKRDIDLYYSYYSPTIRKFQHFKKNYILSCLKSNPATSHNKIDSDIVTVDENTDYLDRLGGKIVGLDADSEMLKFENKYTDDSCMVFNKNKIFLSSSNFSSNKNEISKDLSADDDFDEFEIDKIIEDSDIEESGKEKTNNDHGIDTSKDGDEEDEDDYLIKMFSQAPSFQNDTMDQHMNSLSDSDIDILNNV
ncbi:uncharacterized protein SCODWIG_00750 [Saccharomycodes ludwigii]|uniref:Checkpoint protein RAD24-like helical bundle domain-containing protein n=1 Tax=Saccharomycodes ludwigii TaxID=36035 RepID=A0A376B311_9ASCO|nr:hypothetical protein SCDLUD_001675 [Saccharomycodes ludwigii]KAH3901891.1 hypothetical protein SCDLUD_001675 [Saccharomycodes ludwigii]SSD58989.1 uncharacterized protein SCODWIG_00750 [Saccharomycodes ludwigii]